MTRQCVRGLAGLVAALVASGGVTYAVPLVYEAGPNIGQPYVGPITIKLANLDTGTIYPTYSLGTQFGPTANIGDTAAIGGGVTTLDNLAGIVPPPGALPLGTYAGSSGFMEDSWGIARVTEIDDSNSIPVWTPTGKNSQITVLFYGEQDYHVYQMTNNTQMIDGIGLHADFYERPGPINFDGSGGTAARTPGNLYPTVTDGTLIMKTKSLPGFLYTAGNMAGPAAEFESIFNSGTLTGSGDTYLGLTDPLDPAYAQFHTQSIWNPNSLTNGVANADLKVHWTTSPGNVADWLVASNDPALGAAAPEPASLAMLVCGAAGLLIRRKKPS